METNWVKSYYHALEFFYWEPQHIGRKKHVSAKYDTVQKVKEHLHDMEVTLNHNLSQFFLLAPCSLRNKLFAKLFAQPFEHQFDMHGGELDGKYELANSMQPDLVFSSDAELVSVEMKLEAKSSIAQALKYAWLGLRMEMARGKPRKHYLALLGKQSFSDLWQEKFESPVDLQNALAQTDLSSFFAKLHTHASATNQERFKEIVSTLSFAFLSYAELADFLQEALPTESDVSTGAEVYRKLVAGLLNEFQHRHLTSSHFCVVPDCQIKRALTKT